MITHLLSARRLSKGILLATSIATLAACTGNPTPSSSSAPQQQSSSSLAISSAPASSSSIAPSSSSIASSSSVAPSSSSIASSSSSPNNNSGTVNLLGSDGTFANGKGIFSGNVTAPVNASFSWGGEVDVQVNETSEETWHVQLTHSVSIERDQTYSICFRAKADANRSISVNIDQGGSPGTGQPDTAGYASVMPTGGAEPMLLANYNDYKYTFTAAVEDSTARLTMNFGVPWSNNASAPLNNANVQVDDIGVYEGSECGDPANVLEGATGSGSRNITSIVPITTEGNQVLFGGKQGSLAGVSLFWSNDGWGGEKYYNENIVREVKSWGAKLIRASMGVEDDGGYLDSTGNEAKVRTVVQAAIDNDMYVIIDWHSHHAEDYEAQAIDFFKRMANDYKDKPNVIYEIYNEPLQESTWSGDIKPYAVNVIREIRAIDPDNLIIVGTRSWSQRVDEAAKDPIVASDFPGNPSYADNIAYTLHFYAATHKEEPFRRYAREALTINGGIPLFVTEWGTSEASGAGAIDLDETETWMQFLYDNNISHANWALNDKAFTQMGLPESSSALKAGASANGNWSDADLTPSGIYVKGNIATW